MNIPEVRRDLRLEDDDWLKLFYPWLGQKTNWWLEFRFTEDRPDGAKTPPVALHFLRDPQDIAAHLRDHRALAAARATELQRDPNGPWPAGLFWALQPRVSKRSGRDRVAATVALTVRLAAAERPRHLWKALHLCPQPPSVITWGDEILEAWWLLREPLLDKGLAEEAQRGIANYFCVPPEDAACLCRWPNTFSYQRLPGGRPRSVRVVWCQPERLAFTTVHDKFRPWASPPARTVPSSKGPGLVWKRFERLLAEHEQVREFWQGHPAPLNATDRFTLNVKLATMVGEMSRSDFLTVAALAAWNSESAPGELGRAYDEARRPHVQLQPPMQEVSPGHSLPEAAWTEWARLYRDAMKDSTTTSKDLGFSSFPASSWTAISVRWGPAPSAPC